MNARSAIGHCLSGGLELPLGCHFRLAAAPPLAVAGVLRAVVGAGEAPLAEGIGAERRAVMQTMRTADQREGMRAFLEKRKPVFTGE